MDALTKSFKAVANERRMRILRILLNKREMSVSQISQGINLSFKSTSRHLLRLEDVGLVKRRQDSLWVYYSINRKGLNRYNQALLQLIKGKI
jgi:ArsR family transcriptional regulator